MEVDCGLVRKVVVDIKFNVITLVQPKLRARDLTIGKDHFSGSTRSIIPIFPSQTDLKSDRVCRIGGQEPAPCPLGMAQECQSSQLVEQLHFAQAG